MEKKMNISVACDHAGSDVREAVKNMLEELGYTVTDHGCYGTDSVNYPDYAHLVCKDVQDKTSALGILICGTGIGMSMAANKHVGIRAAVCTDEFCTEMTRRHNDANVLCMGARVISLEKALELAKLFVETEFDGGRHQLRVDMVNALDEIKKA